MENKLGDIIWNIISLLKGLAFELNNQLFSIHKRLNALEKKVLDDE